MKKKYNHEDRIKLIEDLKEPGFEFATFDTRVFDEKELSKEQEKKIKNILIKNFS